MGVMGYISRKKSQFKDYTVQKRKEVIMKKTARLQEENVRQAELAKAHQKLTEAEIIHRDLRQAQGPSNIQKFGSGLAKVMSKTRSGVKQLQTGSNFKGLKLGPPKDSVNKGIHTGSKDVFSIGQVKEKPKPKKRPRVIVEL